MSEDRRTWDDLPIVLKFQPHNCEGHNHPWQAPVAPPVNAYEAARERLEQAVAGLRAAQKARAEAEAYLTKAEAEWAGATSNLRQYETTPGIPLPQYREQVQA